MPFLANVERAPNGAPRLHTLTPGEGVFIPENGGGAGVRLRQGRGKISQATSDDLQEQRWHAAYRETGYAVEGN